MKLLEAFLNALYPKHVTCCACGRDGILNEHEVCEACEKEILYAAQMPQLSGLDGIACGLLYAAQGAELVKRLKYRNEKYLGEILAGYIKIPDAWQIHCIVPVPLHPSRRRKRGYNQSEILAKHLGKSLGVPVEKHLLVRVKNTLPQANITDAKKRAQNVKGAFLAIPASVGKSVLLLDDVITTGSTVEECAKALRRAGAKNVYACSVCRSPT